MKEILALAGKDLRLLIRDKAGSFFVFFFPLLFAVFFGIIFSGSSGGARSIPIALVDEDSTGESRQFSQVLEEDESLDVLAASREEAVSLVQRGKRVAYIILPWGFAATRQNLFWGEPTQIEIGVDPVRKAETAMLQGVLTAHLMEGMMESASNPDTMRQRISGWLGEIRSLSENEREGTGNLERFLVRLDTAMAALSGDSEGSSAQSNESNQWQPVQFEVSDVAVSHEGPKNSFEITFPQAIMWGLIGCAASFGISLVAERTRGTLGRLRMAPLQRWQILAGKALACFTAILFVTILLFLVAVLVFGVRPYSVPMLMLAIVSAGLCFSGVMMLLSVLGKTEASVGGIGWAVLLIMAMIGGAMIPLFLMPSWMKAFSNVSPVKWSILAMEGAVWRGFTLDLMLFHCAVLVAIGGVCFAIGARIFSWTGE